MEKNRKKLLKIFLIFVIIMVVMLLFNFLLSYKPYILKGYYKKDDYSDPYPFHGYNDYFKYYYTAENDLDFKNSKMYCKVESGDIEKLKKYFEDYGNIVSAGTEPDYYDFDVSIIDESDYFILNVDETYTNIRGPEYRALLYDTDSHILYEIYNNNH